ncbi:hypothetical protein HBI21_066690 [Parastagonospora nodorum]|nr:hypothetical protein HBI21_066690 [Parastagonospora nodorum]
MLRTYYIVRCTNNAGNIASQTYKPRRYASSNKGTPVILLLQLLINDRTTLCIRGLENSAPASPLVYSNYALQECSLLTAYALNYLELRVLKLTLIGTVLYNAIKEYHNDRTRKTIYFYSYTVENDYHDNDVDNILIKCIDNKQQRYNTLIEDYNCAGKREDNILTIDKCRTSYSNKEDIEANKREEETRVRLRKLLGEIHNILLREFRRANDFTESVTHNDDEQLEDYDALVERYKEEINYSDLYSTV